jgi:EAL domain-containing protein (putative c-di-GMP-specific phosphodiesterase class I)
MRIKRGSTLIPPGEFLNIAKEGSFYTQLTEIVLTHSIEKIKQCNKISINLSEIDIEKDNIRRFIINLLQENKDVAEHITFELLEDENVEKITNIDEFIEKIKSYGVSIAIDDFGSGYSNFYRLKKYRPDYLKIDGSLIRDIVNDKFSESIVRTIVDFAKENNIKTVAEYVENRKIFEKIKELGVDYSQGYYFGKPVLLNNL